MHSSTRTVCSACSFLALFALACGGTTSGGNGDEAGAAGALSSSGGSALTSMAGTGGAPMGGAAGNMGLAGSESLGGTGGTESAAGSASTAGTEGGSAGSSNPEEDNPLFVHPSCPLPYAEPVPGQVWALLVVNVTDDYLIFQNVTNQPQEISTDYQWCAVPIYERLIDLAPNGDRRTEMIPPGGLIRVNTLIPQGGLDLERVAGEMALYPFPGTYRNPEDIQLFVSWGEGNPTDGRESVAMAAGIWSFGDRVRIIFGDAGFIAAGPTDSSEGFRSVPRPCMPMLPETLEE